MAGNAVTRRSSAPPHSNNQMFRNYYKENDIFCSPEGILKLISVVSSAAVAALSMVAGGAAVAAAGLVAAAAEAVIVLGRVLGAPLLAPQPWLYGEVAVSAAGGALLLVSGALLLALRPGAGGGALVSGSLAIVTACLVVASAAFTYRGATRPEPRARPPTTREHEV